ncbi:MAG: PilZ domain-containing protein [Nitrospirae bacterium]|nr:PilZ domain-containing protein [Nitrospirota bacterium]
MENRAFTRISASVEVRYFCGNTFYAGNVTNVSECGMFISTKKCFPIASRFDVLIRLEDEILKVPVSVSRVVKTDDFYDGMGVEIPEPPRNYLEFVNRLKSASPIQFFV